MPKKPPPAPPPPPPEPPGHLSERSRALWRQLAGGRVRGPGRLTLLEEALSSLDRVVQARQEVSASGLTTKTERSGVLHVSPLVKVEKEARQQFISAWTALGLGIAADDWDDFPGVGPG